MGNGSEKEHLFSSFSNNLSIGQFTDWYDGVDKPFKILHRRPFAELLNPLLDGNTR